MVVWYILYHRKKVVQLYIPDMSAFRNSNGTFRVYLRHFPFVLRIIAFFFIVLALARPQSSNNFQNVTTEGIDIIISMDISSSMLAEDFTPNRLEASKNVAAEFISGRPNDRMGLVVFSSKSFTQCPLTTDHTVLINLFNGIQFGMIEDGTAIGEGIATGINRLKDSPAKSRVMILLTDGVNNSGAVDPTTAAEIARLYGIRIYAIGIGTIGKAPYPFQTQFGIQYQTIDVVIDEPLLKEIAGMTGGKYFRATDNQKLKEIYQEIDLLEKTKFDVKEYKKRKEEFFIYLLIGVLAFASEILLSKTILRKAP
jgi:Ca-activated chloride channel family protein